MTLDMFLEQAANWQGTASGFFGLAKLVRWGARKMLWHRGKLLQVLFDHLAHPFRQEWLVGERKQTLYRIGVRALSKPVTGIVVKIEDIYPRSESTNYLPAPLLLMNTDPLVREFSLRPGEARYIDVIQCSEPGDVGKELMLWHTIPGRNHFIPFLDCKLTISVYATEVTEPCKKELVVTGQPGTFMVRDNL